jgi:hypothetical protein
MYSVDLHLQFGSTQPPSQHPALERFNPFLRHVLEYAPGLASTINEELVCIWVNAGNRRQIKDFFGRAAPSRTTLLGTIASNKRSG